MLEYYLPMMLLLKSNASYTSIETTKCNKTIPCFILTEFDLVKLISLQCREIYHEPDTGIINPQG